jgi:hypothetical protein
MATVKFRLRRDTAANWTAANPVLALGEPGLETDTRRVKYGDGATPWSSLGYQVAADEAAWSTYTPAVSSGSGSLTSASAIGRYKKIGRTVFFKVQVAIVTNGTSQVSVNFTLPVAPFGSSAERWVFAGREDAVTGAILQAKTVGGSSLVQVFRADNSYPGGDGRLLVIQGTYEIA